VVSALGEIIDDGVIHPEEKVKVKVRHKSAPCRIPHMAVASCVFCIAVLMMILIL